MVERRRKASLMSALIMHILGFSVQLASCLILSVIFATMLLGGGKCLVVEPSKPILVAEAFFCTLHDSQSAPS